MKLQRSRPLLCLIVLVAALRAEPILIQGARVFDGVTPVSRQVMVLIEDGRISQVAESLPVPPGARIVDAQGMTLLPGLFDTHTHLLASAGRVTADWGKSLKAYLLSGVTTVVDLSAYPEQFEPMRRLLDGKLPGPHVLIAARLSTPGGHGAEGGRGDFHTQLVQTPEEARAAVRRLLPYRPDLLKVFTDGWRYGIGTDMTSMDEKTLAALVDEAHQHNLKVVTHTVTLDKAAIAARAGVDLINHGISNTRFDSGTLQLMKTAGVANAETLAVYEPRGGRDTGAPLFNEVREPALQSESATTPGSLRTEGEPPNARNLRWENLMANTTLLKEAGITQALGTDAGMPGTFHGWATLHELELLVKGGLTPAEALSAATLNSARQLGLDKDRGTIAEGKRADLLLVAGDPLADIHDIYNIRHVFLDGKEVDRKSIAAAIASPDVTPLEARPAQALLDDFETANGRSRIDTLWINNTDPGVDHSEMSYQVTARSAADHALTVLCKMAEKPNGACIMLLPLARGSIEPVDASAFKGVEFEARGEGDYRLRIPTRSVRDRDPFQAPFTAAPSWKKVRIPFSELARKNTAGDVRWTAKDLLELEFVINRKAGEKAWLELDNVRFYR